MINPMMTDEQNKRMFITKLHICEDYMDTLDAKWHLEGCPHPISDEDDRALYLAQRFYNYYVQILSEDYGCEYGYLICILEDKRWESEFKRMLRDLEGVENELN